MISLYVIHLSLEVVIALTAVVLSGLILYLALFCTKNNQVKVYSHMLIMNASVDLIYGISNLVFLPVLYSNKGFFLGIIGNPLLPRNQTLAFFNLFMQAFMIYLSVVLLPLQFYFWYRVVSRNPLSSSAFLKIFLAAAIHPLVHGLTIFYAYAGMNEECDQIFLESPFAGDDDDIPAYVTGSPGKSTVTFLQLCDCLFIVFYSYVGIMVFHWWSRKSWSENLSGLSEKTIKLQQQMKKLIFLQAIFPLFVLFIPATIIPIHMTVKSDKVWIAELADFLMHSTPVFNSVSVIICIPAYQKIVKKMLYGKHCITDKNTVFVRTSNNISSISKIFTN